MNVHVRRGLVIGLMWLAATAAAAETARPVPKLAVSRTTAKRASTAVTRKTTTRRPTARTDTTVAKAGAKAVGREAPRTLQDIHIEGEIPVPQVLFITARDQRRFLDLQHRRYLETSQQVGERTVLPSWIGVTSHPTDARKENPR
jgi:hypothetical protein